ncbi:copper chaperone PCu(A)C [candidate division KSB1 bacterium]|nr:copper chaperone PCu(A)C [candidate division KSB1 bacterium]
MVRFRQIVFLFVSFVIGCSSSNSPEITIENVWSWPVEAMQQDDGSSHSTGVIYLTIVNEGGIADRLIAIQTEVAEVVEFHETRKQGDMMMMQRLEGAIEIPADGQVEFKPGGLHIMLIGLKRSLNPGERFGITLEFDKSGEVAVESKIRQP